MARRILRAKRNCRFAYMIVSPSNGLTKRVFLSSRLAHRKLDSLRRMKVYGRNMGRVVKLLVLDYGEDAVITKTGRRVSVKKVKTR